MKIINKKDYDETFTIDNKDIKCYSRKKMMELYPEGNYNIIGETTQNNKKDSIDKIKIGNEELNVSKLGDNSKFGFRRKYYIAVNDNDYICVLKSNVFLISLIVLIFGTSVSAMTGLYIYYHSRLLTPDYPLPNVDEKAVKIEGDNTKKVEPKSGGSTRVRLSNIAKVKLSTGIIKMAYQNPNQSTQDSVISLILINNDKEYYIARSGLIKAGNQITELKLQTNGITLKKGIYKGKYIIDHYNPETGEKSLTNSSFDNIEIQVSR